ncbi:16S rRNA (guanine(527)-N(7))-methyltransferase RsmG [Pilimelia terevasa]|uniref:16S rRNA (guanine(527)-N(7))-methyltransferase RsmG n=1 Tax=Pilimelia terevasa TaxID=53372 RepID=UPI001E3D91D7|nr:16S rRNA (guanine(527)-N(7))-methyltransferase RsmG [Pilimelia terevasa]
MPTDPGDPGRWSAAAGSLFGDRLPLAVSYARKLSGDGVVRGLVGPREAPRIWERHLLNCAVLGELIPNEAYVVDIGTGAGLPGIVLAVARPDLRITLVEPLLRRTEFLAETVTELGLSEQVRVVRGRAEDVVDVPGIGLPADVVTSRAVASLDRLAGWCLPLAAVGGRVLALKGAAADEEVAAHADAVRALGGAAPSVRRCGVGVIDPPATVVVTVRERVVAGAERPARGSERRSAARRGGRPDERGGDRREGRRRGGRRS